MTPNLRALADAIHDLGHGGRRIADTLIRLAGAVPPGQAIVDIGPYLGSTTAYLALGSDREIHAYDTWDATICDLRGKARQYHGQELPDDLLPLFIANLAPFRPVLGGLGGAQWDARTVMRAPILANKGDLFDAAYIGGPIGLLVDDIGCDERYTRAKLATFGPHLASGARLVLMDFYWYESKAGEAFDYQRRLVERNPRAFRFVERDGMAAVFEWGGGSVAY
ncbi:MAG TPA: hypothetical protein VFH17_08280 [Coriobacteriia bacterium]|nr:hypothetical protein [Coriobacteriia bacterium]